MQKVNARMASTGLAGFRADNVETKHLLNVEVNKTKETLASGDPHQSNQGKKQLLGAIGEKVVDQRRSLDSSANEIHRLESLLTKVTGQSPVAIEITA